MTSALLLQTVDGRNVMLVPSAPTLPLPSALLLPFGRFFFRVVLPILFTALEWNESVMHALSGLNLSIPIIALPCPSWMYFLHSSFYSHKNTSVRQVEVELEPFAHAVSKLRLADLKSSRFSLCSSPLHFGSRFSHFS